MHDQDPAPGPADATTLAKLRFLSETAIAALSFPDDASAPLDPLSRAYHLVPADASEDMLRTLLGHAVPVLQAAGRRELVELIQRVLAEPR